MKTQSNELDTFFFVLGICSSIIFIIMGVVNLSSYLNFVILDGYQLYYIVRVLDIMKNCAFIGLADALIDKKKKRISKNLLGISLFLQIFYHIMRIHLNIFRVLIEPYSAFLFTFIKICEMVLLFYYKDETNLALFLLILMPFHILITFFLTLLADWIALFGIYTNHMVYIQFIFGIPNEIILIKFYIKIRFKQQDKELNQI